MNELGPVLVMAIGTATYVHVGNKIVKGCALMLALLGTAHLAAVIVTAKFLVEIRK